MGWVKDEIDRVRRTKGDSTFSVATLMDKNELALLEFWYKLTATISRDVNELSEMVPAAQVEVAANEESLTIKRPNDMVAYLLEAHLDPRQHLIRYSGIGAENSGTLQISETGKPSIMIREGGTVPVTAETAARELLQPIVELLAEIA